MTIFYRSKLKGTRPVRLMDGYRYRNIEVRRTVIVDTERAHVTEEGWEYTVDEIHYFRHALGKAMEHIDHLLDN